MSQLGTVYATKRRRRNGKSLKPPPKDGVTKSNPSKRHRERLNAELDCLASLLPFEQNILSKLDRLSILRLSVSYLRTKSYFQVVMHKEKEENGLLHINSHDSYRNREIGVFEHNLLDGDMFLQALNGFLMILTCEGEVFFATHSIESYLGFHQSDIVHQSVYELVHSEDREELQRQLLWNSLLPADLSGLTLAEALAPDKSNNLERSFTVRFRCLLDNTSGFLRLDIRGRIKILHGQNRKTEEPPLALFAFCTPFGPPSLLEIPQKENMFKSKHKLDLSLVSMDQRGKLALGYSDTELVNMGGYDLVHFDDLAYVASAHQELLKTGASGMIAYRFQKKDGEWQWLQTSSRLVYKNSKPDFVICTHRQLMEEEGRDLLGKRTMDFKVSYLDTGLASTYFSEADQLIAVPPASTASPNSLPPPVTPQRANRRYKTQLRDFLSTCRSKRKLQQVAHQGQITSPAPVVEYIPDPAAAVAAAYSNLNPMYTTSPYGSAADNLYITPTVHSTNAFYPVTENLFHQYRLQGVGGYYPDYHHSGASGAYVTNGFLSYDGYGLKEDKWQDPNKYYSNYSSGYGSPTSTTQIPIKTPKSSPHIMEIVTCSSDGSSPVNSTPNHAGGSAGTSTSNGATPTITPKIEHSPPEHYERQTVLMWGTGNGENTTAIPVSVVNATSRSPIQTPTTNSVIYNENHASTAATQLKIDDNESAHLKWNGSAKDEAGMYHQMHHQHSNESVELYGHHHQIPHHNSNDQHQHITHARADVIMQAGSHHHGLQHHSTHHGQTHHQSPSGNTCEVWSPATYSQYQYFSYHHHHHATQHASTQSSLNEISEPYHTHHNINTTNINSTTTTITNSRTSTDMGAHHQHHRASHHQRLQSHHNQQQSHQQSSAGQQQSLSRQISIQSSSHPIAHRQHHQQEEAHHPRSLTTSIAATTITTTISTTTTPTVSSSHHQSVGNISPILPHTQPSHHSHHHHQIHTPITSTRTGVLCCPSLR